MTQYVAIESLIPKYECSKCGWFHDETEAWGIGHDTDRFTCPECNVLLTHSKKVRLPDYDPSSLTGFGNRVIRV